MQRQLRHIIFTDIAIYIVMAVLCLMQAPALAAGPEGYRLYVARFSEGDVAVLDSATHKEVGRIVMGFGSNPVVVMPSPDKSLLYVSNRGHDEIAVIDVKSGKVIARIKTGVHPHFMEFTPDGRYLVVANNQDEKAAVIDPYTNSVVGRPAEGRGASGVAITDDGAYAYITSIYDDEISVIDLKKMERVRVIHARGAMAIVIPRKSRFAYLCTNRDRVSILDIASEKIVGSIPAGNTPNYITLSPDGGRAYVTNALSNTLSVMDLEKRVLIKEIPIGTEPTSSALSPDGKYLFVNNHSGGATDGTISVIDTGSLKEVDRIEFWRNPRALAVLPAR